MVAPIRKTADWTFGFDAIIDVRSPKEFEDDHIPGAINLPVLSNDQRAEVGTIYKQDSAFKARRLGAKLISENIAQHLSSSLAEHGPDWKPLVYCWRGGQRSGSMARVLAEIGWVVHTLEGGYKHYRNHVVASIDEAASGLLPILIQGPTGSAKTDILLAANDCGVQTIDLEGLAKHRGSLLGFDPQHAQPSQRMFESLLYDELKTLDLTKPVLVEAESSRIGQCHIPKGFWQKMQDARQICIAASNDARVDYLIRHYPHIIAETSRLDRLIDGMVNRRGHDITGKWRELVEKKNWPELVMALITQHYDPAYAGTVERKDRTTVKTLNAETLDDGTIADLAKQISMIFKEL